MDANAGIDDRRWHENRATHGWRPPDVGELWRFRELLWLFAARDVNVRYKQAALGAAWAVLRPAVGAAVFTVVFRHVAHVGSDGIPYLAFAYVSFAAWACVSSGVLAAMASLVDNASLVTKVYFPRVVAPAASVLPPLLDLVAALVVGAALLIAYRIVPTVALLALPLTLALLVVVALAAGLWLAALNVQYRDIHHATNLLLQAGLFVSPVAYPLSAIHGWVRHVYALNPATGALSALRWSLLAGPWPGWAMAESLATTTVLLLGGLAYFLRVERRFADVI